MMEKQAKKVPATRTPEEESAREWRKHRLIIRVGQAVMIVGAIVGIVHWLTHIEVFGAEQPPLWLDLAAGYPMAAVLLIIGAIIAGRKQKK